MRLIDFTLPTPEPNLALDEALLLDPESGESLRFWEAPSPVVVLGRSSRLDEECDTAGCQSRGAPVLRRVSGGASIVAGPGCLMYAVTLDLTRRPELADLGAAHRFVLGRMSEALRPLEPSTQIAGTSDLAVDRGGRLLKFSGNSLRRLRERLLYHGTLMYDFDLPLIGRLLRTAPRQPDYREGREHGDFVANFPSTVAALRSAIAGAWGASPSEPTPEAVALTELLVEEKYRLSSWTHSR